MTADELFLKRRKAGVSLSEMAERAGISQGALVDIEKGRIEITDAAFDRLSDMIDEFICRARRTRAGREQAH
jgi:transcriptional regulator with XRE-family HTH domain